MKSKLFQRLAMLVAGLVAAMVILLSQSFYEGKIHAKAKSGQAEKEVTFISAPSDLVPGSATIQLNDNTPALISVILLPEIKTIFEPVVKLFPSRFFKTLFRTVISAQAP